MDLDEHSEYFSGLFWHTSSVDGHLNFAFPFKIDKSINTLIFDVDLLPINFREQTLQYVDSFTGTFPDGTQPIRANVKVSIRKNTITVDVKTPVFHLRRACLTPYKSDVAVSAPDFPINTWEEFKVAIATIAAKEYIYRGQPHPYKLTTSFHRTNRNDLHHYIMHDIPNAHGEISAQTKHFFDLRNSIENAAFWSLLQHHGYPTPLLDWTRSPYIAAFFAFRTKRKQFKFGDTVRIFAFDHVNWERLFKQLKFSWAAGYHFSTLRPVAIENNRAIAQQAISTVTNINDIEHHIRKIEKLNGLKFLWTFDILYSERTKILSDLNHMGITAGSLLPGLDGACEDLKNRNFGF